MSASAGRVLIIPRGDYDSQTTYTMLDMVYYGGKSYICKQTSTGNVPTNTVYWQIMLDGASAFSELTDVDFDNLNDGDGIYYNGTTQKWQNTMPISIAITSPPAIVNYTAGDILDLTGIVVTAYYTGGMTRNVTTECIFSPANGTTLSTANTSVSVSWRTFSTTQAINVQPPIYGVEWDGSSSPAWSRTDNAQNFIDPVPQMSDGSGGWTTGSSPFDTIAPWSGMVKVEDSDAGTLVKIPKYYYKWTRSGSSMKLQISTSNFDGSLVSPAHADRGDGEGERDFVYVGRYHCCYGVQFLSKSGYTPIGEYTRAQGRYNISRISSDVWQWDYAMLWTIRMLYLVEFADWNSQAKIGQGGSDSGAVQNTGLTDSMTYHTGTTKTDRTTKGHTQYRWIEDLWGNVFDFVDGIYFSDTSIYCIKNPADFSDTTGGTLVGTRADSRGYIKAFTDPSSVTGFEYALYPNSVDSTLNGTTYVCDNCTYESTGVVLIAGGSYTQVSEWGLFHLNGTNTSTGKYSYWGFRLMKLPSNS